MLTTVHLLVTRSMNLTRIDFQQWRTVYPMKLCMQPLEHFHPILMTNVVNLLTSSVKHVIVNEFTFWISEPADVNADKFKALIERFDLFHQTNLSTHVAGNTLDLVLTCSDVSVASLHNDHSDHCAVAINLSYVPLLSENPVTTRNGNLLMLHPYNLIELGISMNFNS